MLIDFGLARVAEDPRLTQTGWLLGTPGYLAPEILYGDERDGRLRRARLGGDGGVRGDRPAAVRHAARRWRSWTASAAASTTSSGVPDPLRALLRDGLSPEPLRATRGPRAARLDR